MTEGAEAPSEGVVTEAAPVDAGVTEGGGEPDLMQGPIDLSQMGERLVEVTVDGETVTMPLSEVVANTQRAKASHKRFIEASQARKDVERKEQDVNRFIEELRGENPEELLRTLGIDTQAMVQREYKKLIKWESMTPEEQMQAEIQNERSKLKREKDDWSRQQMTAKEKRQAAQVEAQASHYQEKYTRDFTEALGTVGIPAESSAYPQMLQYMAQVASEALDAGVELKPADLAHMVKEEYNGIIKGFLGNMKPENLHSFLGEDVGKKFRQYDIDRVKGKLSAREGNPQPSRRRPKKQDKKAYNMDEMRALFKSRRMKG